MDGGVLWANLAGWPANVNAPLVPGGPSLYQVFLSGGNPLDSSTWLKQQLVKTGQGMFLNWNTQAGATYRFRPPPISSSGPTSERPGSRRHHRLD